jgi:hypothetical protein
MTAEQAVPFLLNTDIKNVVVCANCIQLKIQLDEVLIQMKSLQKIIEVLQKDGEESKMARQEDVAIKSAIAKHKDVNNIYPSSSSSNTTNLCVIVN